MKLVLCGLWHVHAEQYYEEAARYAEILGVWEGNPVWRREFCEKHGVRAFESFEQLLESGADAAIVCTSTATHAEVMVRLAEAGMDLFTEKVLALTTAECGKIEDAVRRNGVRFVISLPHKYGAAAQTVRRIAESGELGKLNYFRCRNVHDGSARDWLPAHFYSEKECGGGAMIDLGAHGMYLADWFLGMPSAAVSTFTRSNTEPGAAAKNRDGVEDNAVTVLQYPDGAIAVNETGFVTFGYPLTFELGGEWGWVRYDGTDVRKCTRREPEITVVPMDSALPLPITQFCTGKILEGCGLQEAGNLTRLMEMAYGR